MKKFFAAALLAGAAVGAFAQAAAPVAPTITWGGYLDTGLTAQFNGDNKAQLGLWGDDAWKNGGRFKLIGKVALGDNGFNFEIRDQGLLSNSDATVSGNTKYPFYFQSAYAYANFFSKMVYTQVGIVDQRDTRPAGDAAPTFTKETVGAIVVVRPVDGLSVNAFAAPATGKGSAASLSSLGSGGYVPTLSYASLQGNFVDTITSVGAAYTVPNTVKAMAQARFFTTAAGSYNISDAYAGVGLLAVPNLTAWLEAGAYGLNDGAQHGLTVVTETASYGFKDLGVAPLSVGLIAYQYLYGTDYKTNGTDAYNVALRLTPWVSYAFDNGIVPKLAVSYVSGIEATSSGYLKNANAYDNPLGAVLGTTSSTNINNLGMVEIKPSVKFVLSPTQTVNLVYSYVTSVGADKIYYLGSSSATSLSTVQANYTFSF